jgi:hypothetical protein
MKTPKDNRCAQVRTHARGYLVDGKERWQCQTKKKSKEECIVKCGGDAKNLNVKRAIKKNTHVGMDGVSATDKTNTTKMVLTMTTLNVALTLERPWLGCKKEKQQDLLASLLTLSFGYKLVDSFVFVDYGGHTHKLCGSSLSFSLFVFV